MHIVGFEFANENKLCRNKEKLSTLHTGVRHSGWNSFSGKPFATDYAQAHFKVALLTAQLLRSFCCTRKAVVAGATTAFNKSGRKITFRPFIYNHSSLTGIFIL